MERHVVTATPVSQMPTAMRHQSTGCNAGVSAVSSGMASRLMEIKGTMPVLFPMKNGKRKGSNQEIA